MEPLAPFSRFAKGAELAIKSRGNNCVIYTRVSTKEQAEGNLSLETQKKGCEQYVIRNSFNILAYFGGTYESAASDERNEFKRMIEFCKKYRSGVSYIVVYSLERFSRTGDNAIWLSRQLRDLGIQIVSVTQPIDTNNPAGVLQQNILFLFSQYDNDLRRQKTIAGMRERLLRGEWPCHAPIGYDHVTINGQKTIVINEKGKLLRKAFLWKANEGISMMEILQRLESHGLKLAKQTISTLLANPFYCGILSHTLLEGQIIMGKHEKLVSKEIFLKANEEKNKSPHGYKLNVLNDSLPLKMFIKCESCGENLRGYIVKRKNLYYYKCDNGSKCSCNVSAKKLHEKFVTILNEVTLQEKYIKPFQLQLAKLFNAVNQEREINAQQFKTKLKELEQKIEELEEKFIENKIKEELYEKFALKYKEQKQKMEDNLQPMVLTTSNLSEYIEFATARVLEPASLWTSSNYTGKQKIQFRIFPEGIYYDKKNDQPRTPKINSLFLLSAELACVVSKEEARPSELIFKKSGLVSPQRLELWTH